MVNKKKSYIRDSIVLARLRKSSSKEVGPINLLKLGLEAKGSEIEITVKDHEEITRPVPEGAIGIHRLMLVANFSTARKKVYMGRCFRDAWEGRSCRHKV